MKNLLKGKAFAFFLSNLIVINLIMGNVFCSKEKKDNSSTVAIAALAGAGGNTPKPETAPSALTYNGSPYSFPNGITISTQAPTVTGTVTSCTSNPTLPTGLSIAPTTCAISGTPIANQVDTSYTVTASNSLGNTTATISISVVTVAPSALTYSGSPYTFANGSAIVTQTPMISGSILISCASTPTLPTGLSISNSNCAISGTPTGTQAATSYTITATNSAGNTSTAISIAVALVAPSGLIYAGSPYTFTNGATIVTKIPTKSGSALTSCTANPTLPTGLSINTNTCAISGTPTISQAATSYTITATNSAGSTAANIIMTVNETPPSALSYTGSPFTFTNGATIATQTPTVTGTVTSCTSSPTLPTGLSINTNTCAISGIPTVTQAATSYTITATNSAGNTTANIIITVNQAPPSALSYAGNPFTFTNGAMIATQTPTVTGTVTSCTSSPSLPAGLSINTNTCAISGTPTVNQAATGYTITASNSSGNTVTNINITVNVAAPSSLSYSGSPYTFTNGITITAQTPTVTGTVTNCTSSPTLPTGLGINPSTCSISGTPTVTQAATSYTITASNISGNTTTSINITVNMSAPSSLTYSGSPYTFANGVTITTQTPTISGTVSNCTANPSLPTGLGINNTTCAISGTPTISQAATSYTITASNISGNTTASISIAVTFIVATLTFNPPAGNYNTPQNIAISTTTPGASIYYTLFGATPTTSSSMYNNTFPIWYLAGKVVKAIATKAGFTDSPILTGVFTYPPMQTGLTTTFGNRSDGDIKEGIAKNYTDNGNGTISDNATGLLWQKCGYGHTNDVNCTPSSPRHTNWTLAGSYCTTLSLASKTWRLPTIQELKTLKDYNSLYFYSTYFPNTTVSGSSSAWWTSTDYAPDTLKAWWVTFTTDSDWVNTKTINLRVRCVSAPAYAESRTYTDNNNGTIKDNKTGLLWQKCGYGLNNDSTCSGTSAGLYWSAALTYCNTLTLASKTWRLPNINELGSLFEYEYNLGPFINEAYFPNSNSVYWSSTSSQTNLFDYAIPSPGNYDSKVSSSLQVRCVATD